MLLFNIFICLWWQHHHCCSYCCCYCMLPLSSHIHTSTSTNSQSFMPNKLMRKKFHGWVDAQHKKILNIFIYLTWIASHHISIFSSFFSACYTSVHLALLPLIRFHAWGIFGFREVIFAVGEWNGCGFSRELARVESDAWGKLGLSGFKRVLMPFLEIWITFNDFQCLLFTKF